MKNLKYIIACFLIAILPWPVSAQASASELVQKVKAKLDKVNDYEAKGTMKTNVIFIKAPIAKIRVYYKKPNKMRINNESGLSIVPKGSVNINLSSIFVNAADMDVLDAGKDAKTNFRIIKLLPRTENSDVVLSTLYIDEPKLLIKKAITTTRENGTYEIEMSFGKYEAYGLADKVIFSFNTKDYKLPKGVTFDYDDGSKKKQESEKLKNQKGKVEIHYSSYIINRGVDDAVFK